MRQRWLAIWILVAVVFSACNDHAPPPTPTPTRTPAHHAPLPTPARTPAQPAFTSMPLAPTISSTNTPFPTSTPNPNPSPSPPSPNPTPTPILATTPLPVGQGRSPIRIIIPAIALDARVQPMHWQVVGDHTEWVIPANAAGHHIDSAFPGESGNVVISGHHNIQGRVFAQVSRIGEPGVSLGLGDEIILEDELGRRFIYRISDWRRIPEDEAAIELRRENASYLLPTDFPQLTLITCWPATNNTHRVIIQAVLSQIIEP